MKKYIQYVTITTVAALALCTSCSTLEKASEHGFKSGYYKLESEQINKQKVYADVTDDKIDVYNQKDNKPDTNILLTIPFNSPKSRIMSPVVFSKNSLDIDITTIILKYRPSVSGLPAQMTTDFNAALYAGWRHDRYKITHRTDPLGKRYHEITNRGYDFGVFAGTGATPITPFTTQNLTTNEYSGMIIQTGIAGFIETNFASFGLAVGYDYLMNSHRDIWIYNNKPWLGFVIGIALN